MILLEKCRILILSSPEENGKIDRSANILAGKRNLLCGHMKVYFIRFIPLGFVGAPFENDGVTDTAILKVLDWIQIISKSWGQMRSIFHRSLNRIPMGTIPGTIVKSTAASARMKTLKQVCDELHKRRHPGCAGRRVQSCRTRLLGISGCFEKQGKFPLLKTGFISILAATPITMTVCGTRAGKAITILSS